MEKDEDPAKPARKTRGIPRKMTKTRVFNIARFHMERFSCSAGHLRAVLTRRTDRALRAHGGAQGSERAEALGWIEEAVQALQRAGVLDDVKFALALATSLRRKGRAPARIQVALLAKGVPRDVAAQAVRDSAGPGDADDAYDRAMAYIRRRRLGPFRPESRAKLAPLDQRKLEQKELAAVVRAGFAIDIARKVLAEDI